VLASGMLSSHCATIANIFKLVNLDQFLVFFGVGLISNFGNKNRVNSVRFGSEKTGFRFGSKYWNRWFGLVPKVETENRINNQSILAI